IFLNSITQVFLRELVDIYNVNKKECYIKLILNFLVISLIIFISLIPVYFLKDSIVIFIFGENFLNHSNEFFYAITLSGFLFWFNYGTFILNVQRSFGFQIYISGLAFIIQLILCYFLVKSYGYLGTFIAMGSTYILGFSLCILIFLWKEIKNAH